MSRLRNRTSTAADVADELDIHIETLRGWMRRPGSPCPHSRLKNRQLRLDTAEVLAWMKEHRLTGHPGRPSDEESSDKITAARIRKENALARKYEIQVSQALHELIDARVVEQEWADLAQLVRSGFEDIAVQIVPMALRQGMPKSGAPLLQAEIQDTVDRILRAMSDADEPDPQSKPRRAAKPKRKRATRRRAAKSPKHQRRAASVPG